MPVGVLHLSNLFRYDWPTGDRDNQSQGPPTQVKSIPGQVVSPQIHREGRGDAGPVPAGSDGTHSEQ